MVYRHKDRLARIRTLAALMQRHALPAPAREMAADIEALAGGWQERRRRAKRDRLAIVAAVAVARVFEALAQYRFEDVAQLGVESLRACAELAAVDPDHPLARTRTNAAPAATVPESILSGREGGPGPLPPVRRANDGINREVHHVGIAYSAVPRRAYGRHSR